MSKEKEVDQELEEKTPAEEVRKALDLQPNRPPEDQIEEWKAKYEEVNLFGFSEEEVYIFRPLMRQEFVELQQKMVEQSLSQLQYEEMLLNTVVLYKSKNVAWNKTKAGTCSTLSEMIMAHSNFFNPQAASMLVVRL